MSQTLADRSSFAEPWIQFVEEFGEAPGLRGSMEEILQQWQTLIASMIAKYEFPAPDISVTTKEHNIEGFWVREYSPPDSNGTEPIGMYFHGGGWAMGSVDQEDAICRLLSKVCNMRIVSVEYRLAPMYKYPIPLNDCVEATLWALKSFNVDKIMLSGGSAGGNLAFAVALKLIDRGVGEKVCGIAALVPATVMPNDIPENLRARYTSYQEHAEHTVNTRSAMETFIAAYGAPKGDVYASPLLHARLKDLPKVYMTESGTDTLRDDARLMKEALEVAGVKLRYDAYPGYPHYSWTFPSKHLAQHSAEFFGNLIAAVKWIIE